MTISSSIASVYAQLTNFANLSNFWSLFNTAFGSSYDSAKAANFKYQWQSGNFSLFPQIEVVSSDVLGSAKGAYAISTNRIYLSDRFVSVASQPSLEAFGHFVDAQINGQSAFENQGMIFAQQVQTLQNQNLSASITTPQQNTSLQSCSCSACRLNSSSSLASFLLPQEGTSVASGDYRINSLLTGYKWGVTNISFSFYSGGSYYGSETGLGVVSDAIKNNVRNILNNVISPLINLNFVEVSDSTSSYGQIRYLLSTSPGYAYAYYPFSTDTNQGNANDRAGDVFLNPSYDYFNNSAFFHDGFQGEPGTHGYQTLIHETLHALGLKHPGNYNNSGVGDPPFLPYGEENWDNTLMTYNFQSGMEPSTPMAYDVLALQYLYGAKSFNDSNTTYNFTYTDVYSDGLRTVGSPRRFNKLTLWDSGGVDTLNFSNLETDTSGYRFDLSAGGWLSRQTAFNGAGYNVNAGPPVSFTGGTSYRATTIGTRLAYGVTVENLINSSSNDYIIANSAANVFSGYGLSNTTGVDIIEGANNLDILDLSAFSVANVTQTQSGNNLLLGIGSGRSIIIKDYYAVSAASRIQIGFNSNSTPTDLSLSNTSVAENQSVGTSIGTLSSIDPDTGDIFTYSLVTGTGDTDNALFTITGTQIQTNAIFDYEAKNSYSVRVRTTDQGGLTFEKQLTIGITNINETPIVNHPISTQTATELSPFRFTLDSQTFSDPDGDSLSYSATLADNSALPTWLTFSNGTFTGTAPLNTTALNLKVTASDGSLTAESSFTLNIQTIVYPLEGNENNNVLGATPSRSAIIYGYGGKDSLIGGDLGDQLYGGDGNDVLTGGLGDDLIDGGAGTMDLLREAGDVNLTIVEGVTSGSGSLTGLGTDTFSGIEIIRFDGGTGDNTLDASALQTVIANLYGGDGNDVLTGGKAIDQLSGGSGADQLTGGQGSDRLYLGVDTNIDTVYYSNGDGSDTVFDFVRGVGGDILNFTGFTNINVTTSGSNTLFKDTSDNLLITVRGVNTFVAGGVGTNLSGASSFNFL